MHRRFTDNTLLADLFFTGLKLRLNQAKHLALVFLQKCFDDRQDNPKRNKADIHDGKIQRFAQLLGCNIAHIRAFHYNHTGIRTDFPVQLTVSDINGKDFTCTLLKQTICKAAGGST